jgi:hypothetical protein
MTPRKKESALGRGLDALIKPDFLDEDNKGEKELQKNNEKTKDSIRESRRKVVNTPLKPKKKGNKNKISTQSEIESNIKNENSIDEGLVENVILEVRKNPRISLWSAKSAAVLRLLKKTKPEFSISKEASALIEGAVKDKYPDLWEEFEDKDI